MELGGNSYNHVNSAGKENPVRKKDGYIPLLSSRKEPADLSGTGKLPVQHFLLLRVIPKS